MVFEFHLLLPAALAAVDVALLTPTSWHLPWLQGKC